MSQERFELHSGPALAARIAALRLVAVRNLSRLGACLDARVVLLPHQLHTVERALSKESVRWLLADEVGLGKTIEAGLIATALLSTGRARSVLVVVPETLAVQWLGELYRKFQQVFVYLDDARLEDTAAELGDELNPFGVHTTAVVSYEQLARDDATARAALQSAPDLVIVDEAHRLCLDAAGDSIAPLVRASRHALLLTATPLAAGAVGLHGLLGMLRADAFESYESFLQRLQSNELELPDTSAVRRSTLGYLPRRVPMPVDLPTIQEDLTSDPRTAWLVQHARDAARRGEKVLVFVHTVRRLDMLHRHLVRELSSSRIAPALRGGATVRIGVFDPRQSPSRRDLALVRFQTSNEVVLLSSEAGGEGRNFQFCDRVVHFDLPDDPAQLEQRIGRLDRLGREGPVEIVYFRAPDQRPDTARLFERLGLFEHSCAGNEAAYEPILAAVRRAREEGSDLCIESLVSHVARAKAELDRTALHVPCPDGYAPTTAAFSSSIAQIEELVGDFCALAAADLGIDLVERKDNTVHLALPQGLVRRAGLARPSYLGTYSRATALTRPDLDFLSTGHELVQALVSEYTQFGRGRASALRVAVPGLEPGSWLCLYSSATRPVLMMFSPRGEPQPQLVEQVVEALPGSRSLPIASTDALRNAVRRAVSVANGYGLEALDGAMPDALALLQSDAPHAVGSRGHG